MPDINDARSELQKLNPWLYKDLNTTRATGATPMCHYTKRDDMLQRDYNMLAQVRRVLDMV